MECARNGSIQVEKPAPIHPAQSDRRTGREPCQRLCLINVQQADARMRPGWKHGSDENKRRADIARGTGLALVMDGHRAGQTARRIRIVKKSRPQLGCEPAAARHCKHQPSIPSRGGNLRPQAQPAVRW